MQVKMFDAMLCLDIDHSANGILNPSNAVSTPSENYSHGCTTKTNRRIRHVVAQNPLPRDNSLNCSKRVFESG